MSYFSRNASHRINTGRVNGRTAGCLTLARFSCALLAPNDIAGYLSQVALDPSRCPEVDGNRADFASTPSGRRERPKGDPAPRSRTLATRRIRPGLKQFVSRRVESSPSDTARGARSRNESLCDRRVSTGSVRANLESHSRSRRHVGRSLVPSGGQRRVGIRRAISVSVRGRYFAPPFLETASRGNDFCLGGVIRRLE